MDIPPGFTYVPPQPKLIEIDPPIPGPFSFYNDPKNCVTAPCPNPYGIVTMEASVPVDKPYIGPETIKVDFGKPPTVGAFPPQAPLPPTLPPAKREVGLGKKLQAGDIVDGDILPATGKPWNPDSQNKVLRWFDSRWKCDGEYELVNYCMFPTHMELELRRLT